MNRETLKKLEESEDSRVRAIASLAIGMDITFEEAEGLMDEMIGEAKEKINLQAEFEAAMDAEFNC